MVESVAVAQRESASVSPEEVDDSMLPVTPPAPIGTSYVCLRCSHAWNSRKAGRPVACGGCKSRSWWAKESRKAPHVRAPHVKVTAAMEGMR